jgi:N-acyl-D-amino-acid deacylase
MHELVIRGGLVCDGITREPFAADVAVDDGRIAAVEPQLGRGRVEIAAEGMVVAPGFVDIHTHSDFTLPVRPHAPAKLLQGVTTDCTGNCGFSPFPFPEEAVGRRHGVFLEPALTTRWASLEAYAGDVDELRPAINVAPLTGLGAVRLAVVGQDDRAPTPAELSRMQECVRSTLVDGAFGVSSGLIYAPSGFAGQDELAALASVACEFGRIYATHMRDEGDHLEMAVDEAIETGRRSGCAVQISHHKAFGRANWGKVVGTLAAIDAANGGGGDVAMDVYPYTAGCTTLAAALPAAALAGGEPALRGRLADPGERARIAHAAESSGDKQLADIVLAEVPSAPELAGRRLVDAAAAAGVAPAELLLQLVERDGLDTLMVVHGMCEPDLRRVLAHPQAMFGSDGWTMTTDAASYAHPRNFAAAVRMLGAYVRDEPVLSLGEAVSKLAAAPAKRLGISDRGVLATGMAADIVVFDLEALREQADFSDPCRYPSGVEFVLVNGVVAVSDGRVTGARAGRVLRARQCAPRP